MQSPFRVRCAGTEQDRFLIAERGSKPQDLSDYRPATRH